MTVYRQVADEAWGWVLAEVRGDDGPWVPEVVTAEASGPAADRDSLYSGIAGLAPVLAELRRHRRLTDEEEALEHGIVDRLRRQAPTRREASLFDGLAGDVTALRLLSPGDEALPLQRLADLQTPQGWPTTIDLDGAPFLTDVALGTAGVLLTALWAGADDDVVATAADALLAVGEHTSAGIDWRLHPTYRCSSPNFSHGTAGVGAALALTGQRLGRQDLLEAAVAGAAHVLSVGTLDDNGFAVPHTIPDSTRDVERFTWSWCHGPTGTSLLFAALAHVGVDEVAGHDVRELRRRCFAAVLAAGVPHRLRPGFWDNDGRCCGTAGVGDALLDAAQDLQDDGLLAAAVTMADALVERAVRDEAGARWQFVEHRQDPPLLPPGTSWMQGAAGISAFLLRLDRVLEVGWTAPVVDRPDQWWAVPAAVIPFGR